MGSDVLHDGADATAAQQPADVGYVAGQDGVARAGQQRDVAVHHITGAATGEQLPDPPTGEGVQRDDIGTGDDSGKVRLPRAVPPCLGHDCTTREDGTTRLLSHT